MYKTTIKLKAVSPLFMRGADQRKAEFRSASVKGVMRWWFRALAGNYIVSIKELQEVEGSMFGSAGGLKSRVIVEARAIDKPSPIFRNNTLDSYSWVGDVPYLFFSIKMNARKKQLTQFYKPGSRFEVTLKSHDAMAYRAAIASFWTAVALGGFGFRARRGAGSLWFSEENNELKRLKLPTVLTGPDDLKAGINRAIRLVGQAIDREELPIKPTVDYPTLTERTSVVAVLRGEDQAKFALKWEDQAKFALKGFQLTYQSFRRNQLTYQSFRRNRKPTTRNIVFGLHHDLRSDVLDNLRDLPTTRNIVFGLPIVRGRVPSEAKKDRRASPLFVSVKPFGQKYRAVIVKFRTAKFHENQKLNQRADWEALKLLDERFAEEVVFGTLDNFR